MYNDKQEAIKQWTNDPCGLLGAKNYQIGTREFYERVDRNRYEEYAPWMKSVMEFDRYGGQSVLEIGFGMGTDLFQFARAGARTFGVDLSPQHLEIARKRFEIYDLETNLQLADTEHLPFADETFDVVYSFGVIHHTPDTEKAVAEIRRVLKPGGKAILAVYHRDSAFHLCVFGGYLLHLRFFRESYRENLSRIEYREQSDACPLVKLYSRKQFATLLRDFSSVSIECNHLDPTHFGFLHSLISPDLVRRLEPRYGWYLTAKCVK
ncbi:MAG: class I SAM-dependent methyltransferase [Blastocatellia bacterium]|nr:class I SAM-dependent methyltransferase [Blastocatellia bacterium]